MKLVLKETSGEMDVRLIASIHSWKFISEYTFDQNSPNQIQWSFGQNTEIFFMEDFLFKLNYLVIQGDDSDTIKGQVIKGLEIYNEEDIFRLNSEIVDTPEACTLAHVTSLMAPEVFHQDYFELFLRTLHSKNTDVQRCAIFAVNYIPWIQFREILLELKSSCPDLSTDIDIVVEANDTHGWIGKSINDL